MRTFFRRVFKWILKAGALCHFPGHHLYDQPWYLIFGSEESGKKQLLLNSGLCFLKPEYYGHYAAKLVEKFNVFDWYITLNTVFIDMKISNFQTLSTLEHDLMQHVRKRRKSQPIHGVIMTLSIVDLMLATHQQCRDRLQAWASQLTYLHHTFKNAIPLYIILTKSDLISGFCECFSHMNQEALQQICGMTYPLLQSSDRYVMEHFLNGAYDQLIAHIQQHVLWALNAEKRQKDQRVMYAFLQQMLLLKKPIISLVSELFSRLPPVNKIQLRGVYFTSAEQKGMPYDFFLHTIEQRYHLKLPLSESQEPCQESYFIKKLFYERVLAQGQFLGCRHSLWHGLFWLIAPLFLIASSLLYHFSYSMMTQTSTALIQAAQQYRHTSNRSIFLVTVQHIELAYQQQSWIKYILFGESFLHAAMKELLDARTYHESAPIKVISSSKQLTRQNQILKSHIKTMQTNHFTKNHQAQFSFFIKPLVLDNQASHAILTVGNTVLYYAHGPEEPLYMQWSFAKTAQIKLVITDFKGHHSIFSSQGPWALFHLLENSHFHAVHDGQSYIFTPQIGTHTISFAISKLKGIKLPLTLGAHS